MQRSLTVGLSNPKALLIQAIDSISGRKDDDAAEGSSSDL